METTRQLYLADEDHRLIVQDTGQGTWRRKMSEFTYCRVPYILSFGLSYKLVT